MDSSKRSNKSVRVKSLQRIGISLLWIATISGVLVNIATGNSWGDYTPFAWLIILMLLTIATVLTVKQIRFEQETEESLLNTTSKQEEAMRSAPNETPSNGIGYARAIIAILFSISAYIGLYYLMSIAFTFFNLSDPVQLKERVELVVMYVIMIIMLPTVIPIWILKPRMGDLSHEKIKSQLDDFQKIGEMIGIEKFEDTDANRELLTTYIRVYLRSGLFILWVIVTVISVSVWGAVSSFTKIIPEQVPVTPESLFSLPTINLAWKTDGMTFIENYVVGTAVLLIITFSVYIISVLLSLYSIGPATYGILHLLRKTAESSSTSENQNETAS